MCLIYSIKSHYAGLILPPKVQTTIHIRIGKVPRVSRWFLRTARRSQSTRRPPIPSGASSLGQRRNRASRSEHGKVSARSQVVGEDGVIVASDNVESTRHNRNQSRGCQASSTPNSYILEGVVAILNFIGEKLDRIQPISMSLTLIHL